ncbi:MAG: ATP-binding protein [Colwellia sp.]|nr:ATP-binding protein [Colwellia sp.]
MGYKEKFKASRDTAYYANIATKIERDLTNLRTQAESSPTAPRRWVWELLQNARDVHPNGGVNIQIESDSESETAQIIFRHNGRPFSSENIRFLIEQISSKQRGKDEDGKRKSSGKFGTGFLTTHLLSEVVEVVGIAKELNLDYKQFKLTLDRSGEDLASIIEAVETSTKSVENLDEFPPHNDYKEGQFNTSFHYPLENQISIGVAKKGLTDLQRCLPYTLTFVPEINSLELLPGQERFQRSADSTSLDNLVEVVTVEQTTPNSESSEKTFYFATLSKDFTTIAIPILRDNGEISIGQMQNELPRLFCDFPLVGTENFPFPVIINNPNFNPTEPRDGILLTGIEKLTQKVIENRTILKEAIDLYLILLEFAASNKWQNLHLLANLYPLRLSQSWITSEWYRDEVLNPIRKRLLSANIVNTENGGEPVAILSTEGKKHVWFPNSVKKNIRQNIWELAKRWFPHLIPRQSEIELWYNLSWHECGKLTVDQFAEFVESEGSLKKLETTLKNVGGIKWLNDFYQLLKLEEKEYDAIINNRNIFPNQNGDFCKKQQLSQESGDIKDEFKVILNLLGHDIKADLADIKLEVDFPAEQTISQADVVKEIASEVNLKVENREIGEDCREAFNKLLIWFKNNPESAKILFPDLYNRKHRLYDEEEIIDNMDKAEQLEDLLSDCGAANLDELKKLIEQGKKSDNKLLPITQEILANMGITSLEEWEKALEDKNLSALFDHESATTPDMFVLAQTLIEKAKANIKNHLENLMNYDLSHLEEIATTVIAGIIKDGKQIHIVMRPAYRGEVIIYYTAEQDILDYEESELWVDTGIEQKQVSLGHILKTAGIRKFPI